MNLTGLIGTPVRQSWSQRLFNEIYKIKKMDYFYAAIDLDISSMAKFIGFASSSMNGFNVTSPYKETILRHIEQRNPLVWRIGSANVITNESGTLYAHNTDYSGFKRTLEANNIEIDGKQICIAGTGGVFKTILYCIFSDFTPKSVIVLSREPERARTKFQGFEYMEGAEISGYPANGRFDIVINCTPLGTNEGDQSPVKSSNFSENAVAIDLLYARRSTKFLEVAKTANATCINGREMFFQQALESYNLFHGDFPDMDVFAEVRERLEESESR